MRIGLLRHFPVNQAFPSGWLTDGDLLDWLGRYDDAPTTSVPVDLRGVAWTTCLCSDLPRCRATADAVFSGPVQHTPLLREAGLARFGTGGVRLPASVWTGLLRLAWWSGHRSQRACRDELFGRVSEVADRLCAASGDVLVVSHAVMMSYLSRELRRRGFGGPKLGIAENARLYLYEREGSDPACGVVDIPANMMSRDGDRSPS